MSTLTDDVTTWPKYALEAYVGGLSEPSKMPCHGYSIPASECITGSQLREEHSPGKPNVCGSCYALKNRFLFQKTQDAMQRRFQTLAKPLWALAMAELILRTGEAWFRWHDSGDIQSLEHLERIAEIAERTPAVKHWLPTREYMLVRRYLAKHERPPNLNIRLSAHLVDGPAPSIPGTTGSTVSSSPHVRTGSPHVCPAPTQGNFCGSCRACWDPTVAVVDYHLH